MTTHTMFSNKFHSFAKKLFGVLMVLGLLLSSVPAPAFAAIYAPGATLNPSCLPTDVNCGVTPPSQVANTGLNLASATSSPTTTANQLYNVGGILFWNGNPTGLVLNGLATSTQTFATSSAGTDFSITSSGSTHTFNLPSATSTTRGLLSAADWATFNNKLGTALSSGSLWIGNASSTAAAVTVSGDATISNTGALALLNSGVTAGSYGSGTVIPTFTVDAKGRLTVASTTPASGIAIAGDVSGTLGASSVDKLKGASLNLTSLANNNLLQYSGANWVNVTPASLGSIALVTGSSGADINVSGTPASLGGTLTLNIPDASATARGVISTSTQTIAGSKTFSSAPTISPITAGSVLFAGTGGLVSQNNSNFFWDNTNGRLGIGTTALGERLEVVGNIISKGTSWTSRTSAADNQWGSVTYGNGLFVAVAGSGTGNRVMTSPDGINWTARTSAADNSWTSVTYGNGLFVAVANSGTGNRVMTSPDGINWTVRTSATDNFWQAVTYGNGLFVAVSWGGASNSVMTSPDGINWTIRTAVNNFWFGVTYGNGLFVAVALTGTGNRVMTSPDGINWTARTSAADNDWVGVTYGNGLFVAVTGSGVGNRVMTSPDGINWTSRTTPVNNNWYSITYGNGLFVAMAASGVGNRVMTSPDGINWTVRTSAVDNGWASVAYGNGLFVAVAGDGAGNRVMTSGKADYQMSSNNNIYQGGMSILGGNVGIGTTVPLSKLNVQADAAGLNSNWTIGQLSISGNTNSNKRLYLGYDTSNDQGVLQVGENGVAFEPLLLNPLGGNVGIGTTTPNNALSVNGGITLASTTPSVTASALYNQGGTLYWNGSAVGSGSSQWTTSGANVYYNTGNVAIGTSTPSTSARLLITGAVSTTSTVPVSATGGTITTSGLYTIHTFTSGGTFTSNGAVNVEYLVVGGGGGGGGTTHGAGGGAGGMKSGTFSAMSGGSYAVVVGAGGAGGAASLAGTSGADSSFNSVISTGGGGGGGGDFGTGPQNGLAGGSGGGASISGTAGTGIAGQGNNGGTGLNAGPNYGGGGGGGAGAVGSNGTGSTGGNGGVGVASSITGSSLFYAGGGGGSTYQGGTPGTGGSSVGGAGATQANGFAAVANRGGGGGGGGSLPNSFAGGSGGSGVVIVRYLTAATVTVAISNANQALLRVTDTGTAASSTLAFFEGTSGTGCIIAGATGLSCSSDITLKHNVQDMKSALGNVLALRAVTFDWNNEADGAGNHIGFIAQDVEKIFPGLVVTDPNGKKALSYDKFAPILAAALQEQYGGMMGVNIASVPNTADLFSSTSTLDALASASVGDNFIADPIAYIRERVEGGMSIVRNLVTERIVAVTGYFKRIFANELCLTDSDGKQVCVTGDQLKNIGGSEKVVPTTTSATTTTTASDTTDTTGTTTPPETPQMDSTSSPHASESTPTASSSGSVDPTATSTPVIETTPAPSPTATDSPTTQTEATPAEVTPPPTSDQPSASTEPTVPASSDVTP